MPIALFTELIDTETEMECSGRETLLHQMTFKGDK